MAIFILLVFVQFNPVNSNLRTLTFSAKLDVTSNSILLPLQNNLMMVPSFLKLIVGGVLSKTSVSEDRGLFEESETTVHSSHPALALFGETYFDLLTFISPMYLPDAMKYDAMAKTKVFHCMHFHLSVFRFAFWCPELPMATFSHFTVNFCAVF